MREEIISSHESSQWSVSPMEKRDAHRSEAASFQGKGSTCLKPAGLLLTDHLAEEDPERAWPLSDVHLSMGCSHRM